MQRKSAASGPSLGGLFFNNQFTATTKRNAIGVGVGDLPLTPFVAILLPLRHTTAYKIPKPPWDTGFARENFPIGHHQVAIDFVRIETSYYSDMISRLCIYLPANQLRCAC